MTEKEIISVGVTVDEVKAQLNIENDFTNDDVFIQSNIEAAADRVSGIINADVALTKNTVVVYSPGKELRIHDVPLYELVSIKSNDIEVKDNFTIEKSFSFFTLKTDSEFESLSIVFNTGHKVLPAGLKKAVIIAAADLYDAERSNKTVGVSISDNGVISSLVRKYIRRYW